MWLNGEVEFAGVAQLVEQLICNQQVAGSSPIASLENQFLGEVPKWTKGADCKSAGFGLQRFESSPLQRFSFLSKKWMARAGVAQLVEHQPSKLRVAGSNPVSRSRFAHVAQSAEHFLGKEEVTGSIPVVGCNK